MAFLIPVGTDAAVSADITLADDEETSLFLAVPSNGGDYTSWVVIAYIEVKEGSDYFPFDQLDSTKIAGVLRAKGTFRLRRPAGTVSYGVIQG